MVQRQEYMAHPCLDVLTPHLKKVASRSPRLDRVRSPFSLRRPAIYHFAAGRVTLNSSMIDSSIAIWRMCICSYVMSTTVKLCLLFPWKAMYSRTGSPILYSGLSLAAVVT